MNAVIVTLANRSYFLRHGTSVRRLEKHLIAAVRRGAGIVRLPLANGPEVHALVSPATPVTIEVAPERPAPAPRTAARTTAAAWHERDLERERESPCGAEVEGATSHWLAESTLDWPDFEPEFARTP